MVDAHDSFLLVAIVAIRAILIINVLKVKSVVAIVWQFVATEGRVWQRLWQLWQYLYIMCQ